MEEQEELNKEIQENESSTLSNPDKTFCEKTTYLDFLLSNAKTEEEKEDIKETINNYLDITDPEETE